MISKFLSGKQNGFTIIELLVIVVVIAILAGIAIVAYPAYQERARDAKRKADLHAIIDAYKAAVSDGKTESTLPNPFYPNFTLSSFGNAASVNESPTIAGNINVAGEPGGELGELGYLTGTLQDPKWTESPDPGAYHSSGPILYSGYILVKCLNDEGYYGLARLETPSAEDISRYNNFIDEEVNTIGSNGANPGNTNSCFHTPQGDNLAESASSDDNFRDWVLEFFSVNTDYNYAIHVK